MEKTYKIFSRINTKTQETIQYKCRFDNGKLASVVNLATGLVIPEGTRTFKKIHNGHKQFVISES